jgi:hypothetical protein
VSERPAAFIRIVVRAELPSVSSPLIGRTASLVEATAITLRRPHSGRSRAWLGLSTGRNLRHIFESMLVPNLCVLLKRF